MRWLAIIVVALGGCWADFPDSRFELEASVVQDSGPGVEGSVPGDGPSPGDLPVTGDVSPTGDTISCTPSTFIRCSTAQEMEWCNVTGNGITTVDCSPYGCSVTIERCQECDPATSPPECHESTLVFCSPQGINEQTQCPAGCEQGACCPDQDQDTYSPCTGDCADQDPRVNPGQTEFQTTVGDNGFDFNCDGSNTKEYPNQVSCVLSGGTCTGSGWVEVVPDCGSPGQLAICQKKANECEQVVQQQTQGCL
jgi:hypothetical protein